MRPVVIIIILMPRLPPGRQNDDPVDKLNPHRRVFLYMSLGGTRFTSQGLFMDVSRLLTGRLRVEPSLVRVERNRVHIKSSSFGAPEFRTPRFFLCPIYQRPLVSPHPPISAGITDLVRKKHRMDSFLMILSKPNPRGQEQRPGSVGPESKPPHQGTGTP